MELLALIGAVTLGCVGVCLVSLIFEGVKELIENLKHEYRYKHRFEKPPTAKCYCVDCKYYNVENHRCYGFHEDSNRLVADNMFCYRSEPCKKENNKNLNN